MKREEYSARLHKEMEPVRVSRQLRARTLAALCQGRPIKEDTRMTIKHKFTVTLAVVLSALLLSGVALAAASHWGVLDFVTRSDTWLPEDAQSYFTDEVLIAETDAGVLTVREAYYDGYRAHITADLVPKDQKTLLLYAWYDIQDVVGNLFRYTLEQAEADRRTVAQFYKDGGYTSLWLADLDAVQMDCTSDSILHEDGTLTFYLQTVFPDRQPTREMPLTLSLFRFGSADEYDYARYVTERTKISLPLTLTAHPEASCRTFVSEAGQEYPSVGVRVDRITVEVMPLDIYASIEFTVTDQAAFDKLEGGLWFEFIDPASTETSPGHQRLKQGLSSDGSIGGNPGGTAFIQHETLSPNELHGEYVLRAYSAWTKERYETCTFVMREVTQGESAGK